MTIRERTELFERNTLSVYATLSAGSRGRSRKEEPCTVRTEFQRDRDRILHSKAFRRLKHKTQVFIAPEGDHYRTRLTHTLEVAQIARTIARALMLNEDLTEAIALGHDLGHTPFGHAGEKVLDELYPGGFKHFEQSLRVVDCLEGNGGLNLTFEVRDGIVTHAGKAVPKTLEGKVVKFADRIAYVNHDIDDAIRAGLLSTEDLPKECREVLGETNSQRINTLICDIISESLGKPDISMSPGVHEAAEKLREFMFERVYIDSVAKAEEKKVRGLLSGLYEYFVNNPHEIPEGLKNGDDAHRAACDFIAGMTDRYAVQKYEEIFVPRSWAKY